MSSFLLVVMRVGVLVLFLIALKAFSWPDISPYLMFIQGGIDKLYFLNPIFDMDTFFTLAKFALSIEILYIAYKLIRAVVLFISGGSFGSSDAQGSEDSE